MPSNELLLREKDILDQLYNAESMMEIEKSVAQGYITLLGGNDHCGAETAADPALSFMALTQGNVIDVCFGVSSASISRGDVTPNMQASRAAKALLDECASNSTRAQFQQLAVTSYKNAFEEIVAHAERGSKLNCVTRCCRPKSVRDKTEQQLKAAFLELAKAVEECPILSDAMIHHVL
ncbi:MAG: hypothetical protein SGBAC_002972 [Bacillariaceae sp.]